MLMSYQTNIFCDWYWGEKENKASTDLIADVLKGQELGNCVMLGAGSGRLAYDMIAEKMVGNIVALAINPLLLTIGAECIVGKKI